MWSVNELSVNANGGTEMMQRALWEKLSPELRDKVHIICSRVRDLSHTKPNILWHHDLAVDPEAAKAMAMENRFVKHVFVSHWQWEGFKNKYNLRDSRKVILKNAIEPIPFQIKNTDGPIRLIYHTTPHRGLSILYGAFSFIYEHVRQDIHLDVYSSFEAYGWPQRDKPFEDLFNACRSHPAITYHGYKPNPEVREALQNAHIFAYPSVWLETSCIAAIEAMSAGCLLLMPRFGALPETCWEFPIWYDWTEKHEDHLKIFTEKLIKVLDKYHVIREVQSNFVIQRALTNEYYGWNTRILEWESFIKSLEGTVHS